MSLSIFSMLAQASAPVPPPAPPAERSFLSLDTLFWFTVLTIFIVTILSALLRRLSKDKALSLFHEYHVSFFSERRATLWGDCLVYSQGIELLFDQAFTTRRKLVKSSALLYDDEFGPMVCLTRSIHGLHPHELEDRKAQIHATFKPGLVRRARRWFRNMLNTMRDAITKTMNLVVGRFTAAAGGVAGAALATQTGDINALAGNVMNLAANAYEPLLERYIGQPVILEINLPAPPGPPPPPNWVPPTAEFPGYLVDYTQRFLAVFNVDHEPVETLEIVLEPGKPPVPDLADFKVTLTDADTIIRCEGKDAFVLRTISSNGEDSDLGIAMIPGTSLVLARVTAMTKLAVERTRQIDLIVPRSRARIRFGSMPVRPNRRQGRRNWLGLAPVLESREILQTLRANVRQSLRTLRGAEDEDPPRSGTSEED
jgi:hypothetical protein